MMGEQIQGQCGQEHTMDTSNNEMVFDNLTILKELSNIVNIISTDEFLETVPKSKLRVKWMPIFNYLKQSIYNEMVQELNSMWKFENMPQMLEILEKQKEKFNEISPDKTLWRPQLGDVKAQLRAHDFADLQSQKASLESLAKEYENRVNKLKKTLSAKRGYLKVLQMDIQKYQKKSEDFITQINNKIENQEHLIKRIIPSRIDVEANTDMDCNE